MIVLFYLPKSAMNEATEYYSNLMIKSFNSYEVIMSETPFVEEKVDIIVTIRLGDQSKLRYAKKNKKYIYVNWFQGIGPEEYELLHNYTLKSKLGKFYLSYLEKKGLKKTNLCFFVSKAMKDFYENKYKLNLENKSIVVPCYNKELDESSFLTQGKYENLSFVYAGALYGWQCIEESLQVFKKIYENNPAAQLTLLTGQKEQATDLIKKYNLKNVSVGFVKLEDLQDELAKYKYGFLLRKNDPINNVATPTKMNSYLAAGIIPVYTDVVEDFEENIDLLDYSIKFRIERDSLEKIADEIIIFDKKRIVINEIRNVYKQIFSQYYCDDKYINEIRRKLASLNL